MIQILNFQLIPKFLVEDLDIQDHRCLPSAVSSFKAEVVQGNRFYIDTWVLALGVEGLTPGDGLKDIRFSIRLYPGLIYPQNQLLGILVIDQLLYPVEKKQVQFFVFQPEFPPFPGLNGIELFNHDVHGGVARGYKYLFQVLSPGLKGNVCCGKVF